MTSSRWTVLVVLGCAVAVLSALAWASAHALRLEARDLRAQDEARLHEKTRLALWRMDAAINSVVAREAARPYFHYSAFYPADRAYTAMWEEVRPGEVLVPSPLLAPGDGFVLLHYQRDHKGAITSPQAPSGNMRDLAEAMFVSSERVIAAQERLESLASILKDRSDAGRTAASPVEGAAVGQRLRLAQEGRNAPGTFKEAEAPPSLLEYEARQQAAELARAPQQQERRKADGPEADAARPAPSTRAQSAAPGAEGAGAPLEDAADRSLAGAGESRREEKADALDDVRANRRGADAAPDKGGVARDDLAVAPALPEVEQGEFVPQWRLEPSASRPVLLLVRKVQIGSAQLEQGCWLDWEALRGSLLDGIRDLLPAASIAPVIDAGPIRPEQLGRRLAGIAAELDPGPVPAGAVPAWTPMRTTLVLTWITVILALVAVAAVLHAARELAERRGRFVSAVTHELRTPLTTFCLYSQMLADGMVGDEVSRAHYLGTLKRESQRLARIVENVLEFARLGRSTVQRRAESITVAGLLSRLAPALEQRASQGAAELVMEPLTPEAGRAMLHVDPATVERILVNLVDNACKYACDGGDKRIGIGVGLGKATVDFSVTDHGPGVEPRLRPLIFRPFQRGQSLAHASTPGLGLGLALSRGLARQVGGDLVLDRSSGAGSRFVLSLPAGAGHAP